tara:strand:- start:1534 stop:2037 length:504 start_codon:yes stop_codon:yes gene_type:complete
MDDERQSQKQLAVTVAKNASDEERLALLTWSKQLLEIRDRPVSNIQKGKQALQLTLESKVIWPTAKIIGREIKRLAWDDRGTKGRLSLAGITIGLTVFGGQGAGIAALGTAVGVPLWVVLGAGGAFAGMLIDELKVSSIAPGKSTTIEAKKVDSKRDSKNGTEESES